VQMANSLLNLVAKVSQQFLPLLTSTQQEIGWPEELLVGSYVCGSNESCVVYRVFPTYGLCFLQFWRMIVVLSAIFRTWVVGVRGVWK
jgi:hypothetical protein